MTAEDQACLIALEDAVQAWAAARRLNSSKPTRATLSKLRHCEKVLMALVDG